MHAYAGSSFVVGADVQGSFETTKHQGKYDIQGILNTGEDPLKGGEYKVEIAWVGLNDEDPPWQPIHVMFRDVTKFLV